MLKQLEIQGFKSFADKAVLNFPSGITAVVGPNGSGKSNVVDSIRWVFGEQSQKNMRINSAEDVIFNGTTKKQANNLAQVALVFDNQKKVFPVDFDEVEIRRKVYRDGSSEYFLNKQQVRLKDLVQILASAKLGVKGMSIVNQGAGDIFLKANSVERREIIEEMVGLKDLRLKKEEADRKIRETRENLNQVETILSEISPNLRSLKRQVDRWQSRQEKESALKELEKEFFLYRIAKLLEERRSFSDYDQDSKKLQTLQQALEKTESELKVLTESSSAETFKEPFSEKISSFQSKKQEVLRQLGHLEGQLEFLSREPKAKAGFDAGSAEVELQKILSKLKSFLAESSLDKIKAGLASLAEELEKFLFSADHLSANRDAEQGILLKKKEELTLQISLLDKEIDENQKSLLATETSKARGLESILKIFEEQRRQVRLLEQKILDQKVEREKLRFVEEDLRMKLSEAGFSWEIFLSENQEFFSKSSEKENSEFDLTTLEKKIFRLKSELSLIGEVDQETLKEFQAANERFEFLSTQKKDLDEALVDLEGLSEELEGKITIGFEEALKKIDQEFQKYFGIIFEGGKASLKIEKAFDEETKVASFGIEIAVNLPRKKIKSLEMLSGGERSLTAVALLFAVINYARPPFLVLDEIDAALDESNSRKLAKVLKEFVKNSVQFVLITHNRAVMESADVLYGITMSDGISRLFSLRFKEAEELASQDIHQPAQ